MSRAKGKPRQPRGPQPAQPTVSQKGFYTDQFTSDELALVATFLQDPTLSDELWLQRVLNRRLTTASQLGTLAELMQAVAVLAVGTGRVARLLRDQRALSGQAADGITGALSQVLDELGTEWGIEL